MGGRETGAGGYLIGVKSDALPRMLVLTDVNFGAWTEQSRVGAFKLKNKDPLLVDCLSREIKSTFNSEGPSAEAAKRYSEDGRKTRLCVSGSESEYTSMTPFGR